MQAEDKEISPEEYVDTVTVTVDDTAQVTTSLALIGVSGDAASGGGVGSGIAERL